MTFGWSAMAFPRVDFAPMELVRHVQVMWHDRARMTDGSHRGRVLTWLWIGIAVIWALGGIRMFLFHITYDPFNDTRVYYDAAVRLNEGLPLYPPGARIYPPLFSILWRPLALLPFEVAAVIWEAILIAALGVTLWLIGIRRPATWWAALVLSIGIAWVLAVGQAEAIVTLLLTIGSPFTVALAANIKIFPVLVGTFWLARRDWRNLGFLVGWTAGLVVLQLVLDPADTLAFPATLSPSEVTLEVASVGNISPFALSPVLWAILAALGFIVALRLGPSRWGWGAAVALAVLVPPRLFSYNMMSLLACLKPTAEVESGISGDSRSPRQTGTESSSSRASLSVPRRGDANAEAQVSGPPRSRTADG